MRNVNRFFVSASALLLLASPALAQDLESSLVNLSQAQGDAYVQARDALLAQPGTQQALQQRQSAWTAQSWQADAMAAVLESRLADPAIFQDVATQRGVNPSFYNQRRVAIPNVYYDLQHKAERAAPAVVEQLLKLRTSYALVPGDREGLRAKEELALHEGLLMTLGKSKHPAAPFVLTQELLNGAYSVEARRAAAVSLGMTGVASALPTLTTIANDASAPEGLRVSSLIGVSRVFGADAFTALDAHSRSESLAIRKAAVAGMGYVGSAWAWEARGQLDQSADFRAQVGERLVQVLVEQAGNSDMEQFAIQGICSVGHPVVSERLEELAGDENQSDAVRAAVQQATTRLQIAERRKNRGNR